MDAGVIASVIAATLNAGTPLLIAAIGILIHEKSGVLNLGVEGMMLMGAVTGFGVTYATGSFALGFLAGALAGLVMAALFGFFTLGLYANQYAAGLALSLFGAVFRLSWASLCRAWRCRAAHPRVFPVLNRFRSWAMHSFRRTALCISP